MNVVQRYLFRRLFAGFLLAFPALSISIWLSQALQKLSLVTDRGQGIPVFLEASALLIPGLIVIIGPVTMLIVVISTINALNSDSELVSLSASGASPSLMLRPVLVLAIPLALLSALCSMVLNPQSARATSSLLEEVNSSLITSVLRSGQFRTLGDNVVIEIDAIHPDGALEGLFVFDGRDRDETVAYVARAGAMITDETGKRFLVMQNGVIQRKPNDGGAVSVIQFNSYAFNLSNLASQAQVSTAQPNQRPVGYLLNPDPSDPVYQANPFRYMAEFHNRLAIPLYVLALALLPLALLGQVQTERQGRGWITTLSAVGGAVVMGAGLYLSGALETNAALLPLVYGVPLGVIGLSVLFVLSGRRPPTISLRGMLRAVGIGRRRRMEAGI